MGLLATALAMSACSAGGFGSAEPTTAARQVHRYVALGDSFTAAPRTGAHANDDACQRSDVNYPSLVAKALRITDVHDASCSGATTGALTEPMKVPTGDVAQQTNAVEKDTELVTIGMGIEDRGLLQRMFEVCTALPCVGRTPPQTIVADVGAMGRSISSAIRTVQDMAPEAQLIVIGYPRIAPDTGSCRALRHLDQADLDAAKAVLEAINRALSSAARQAGAAFVDVAALSAGHELCSSDPWVIRHEDRSTHTVQYHPVPAEQRAVADAVAAVVRSS